MEYDGGHVPHSFPLLTHMDINEWGDTTHIKTAFPVLQLLRQTPNLRSLVLSAPDRVLAALAESTIPPSFPLEELYLTERHFASEHLIQVLHHYHSIRVLEIGWGEPARRVLAHFKKNINTIEITKLKISGYLKEGNRLEISLPSLECLELNFTSYCVADVLIEKETNHLKRIQQNIPKQFHM